MHKAGVQSLSLLVAGLALILFGRHRAQPLPDALNASEVAVVDPSRIPGFDLGTPGQVAAFLWLRVVSYSGEWAMKHELDETKYDYLIRQLDAIVRMDPYAKMPFLYASTVLAKIGSNVADVHQILLRSLEGRAQDWEVYFALGLLYYRFYGRLDRAAEWWKLASVQPDVLPKYLGNLAQFLILRQTGAIDALLADFDTRSLPPDLRSEWLQIHKFHEQQRQLAFGIDKFIRQFGRAPKSIDEVVAAGIWWSHPRDPWGGEVHLAADGKTVLPSHRIPISPHEQTVAELDPLLDRGILPDRP